MFLTSLTYVLTVSYHCPPILEDRSEMQTTPSTFILYHSALGGTHCIFSQYTGYVILKFAVWNSFSRNLAMCRIAEPCCRDLPCLVLNSIEPHTPGNCDNQAN